MSWTDWLANLFRYKPKPNYWETLFREQLARGDELLDKLVLCQSESSKVKSELSLAVNQIGQLNASIKSLEERNLSKTTLAGVIVSLEQKIAALEKRNQSLQSQLMVADNGANITDSLTQQLKVREDELKDATSTIGSLRVEIDTLKREAVDTSRAADITPESFAGMLEAKYPEGTDRSKVWDLYDNLLTKTFALKLTKEPTILTSGELIRRLALAFPDAKFIGEVLDNLYYAPECEFIERAVRNDFGNLKIYVPEQADCDDFAEDLRVHFRKVYGYNIGVIVIGDSPVGPHAWTLLVGSDGIVMVEPQNDSMTRIPDILPGYVVRKFHTY